MPGGRPLKYKTPEEMQKAVDAYFVDIEANDRVPTIAGFALYLGFDSRISLYNYEGRPEFLSVIKKARARIEAVVEALMLSRGHAGHIFWLKNNAKYEDKQTHAGDAKNPLKLEVITGIERD